MTNHTDSLTGLPDRSALGAAIESAIQTGQAVSLAVLDIDNFLDINTHWGRDVGDHVLQVLGDMVGEAAPGNAYRITGDEYAVLLPGFGLEQAFLRMEALRANVESAAERFGLPDQKEMTVTIGVAQYPRDAKEQRSLLLAADAALQAAKENGRNQVGLPLKEEMVTKSCYYPEPSVRKLAALAKRRKLKESHLLREALDDLFRKYDTPREA